MIRTALFIAVTFFIMQSSAQNINLSSIRKDFDLGIKDESVCEKYHELLNKKAKTPVEKGYKAAFHMFMAKHTSNPIKKMSYFNEGKKMLQSEVVSSPNNVELRFIRLCIQYYTPKYLGFHQDIEKDKQFVANNLYKLSNSETKKVIYDYLKGAKMYNQKELELLGR